MTTTLFEAGMNTTPISPQPVALITGAARRVGQAIALELADAGYDIALHFNRSGDDARKTAHNIQQQKQVQVFLVQGDWRNPEAPRQVIAEVSRYFGRLDVLVNSASVFEPMSLDKFDFKTWHDCLHINLAVPIKLCQLAAPIMRSQGNGCIVNLSDISVRNPTAAYLSYGPSKAGLDYVTRALALALAPTIRVNAVAPGIAVFPENYSPDLQARLIDQVPLKRSGTPRDVAQAVRFLVESQYITGHVLPVDGGKRLA